MLQMSQQLVVLSGSLKATRPPAVLIQMKTVFSFRCGCGLPLLEHGPFSDLNFKAYLLFH